MKNPVLVQRKKTILTNINSLFQVNFTWLHYMEFFSWGQASPTWTRLMQNTEKEKLLMKVNAPRVVFSFGKWDTSSLYNFADKSRYILKVFIIATYWL